MKAVLLAAGVGSRLRPLTDRIPKCMVMIDGQPLLDIWLDALAGIGVDETLVNLHHLPEVVEAHLAQRDDLPRVSTVREPSLLGSAGTLRANADFLSGEDMFLAAYADTLTDFDLGRLVEAHRETPAIATIAVFRAPRPSECGILEVADGIVTGFEEKPSNPSSDLANAGMYAFSAEVLTQIDGPYPRDIGYDLLPQLVGRARVVDTDGAYLSDIGTPAALERASMEWKQRARA